MNPLRPEDDLAIRRLYARYNETIRLGDAEAWASCFAIDGRFSNRGTAVAGRAELITYAAGWIGSGNARYWIDNLLLSTTAQGVFGTCYLVILHAGNADDRPSLNLTGIYTDSLERVDGEWKFASRHIERDS